MHHHCLSAGFHAYPFPDLCQKAQNILFFGKYGIQFSSDSLRYMLQTSTFTGIIYTQTGRALYNRGIFWWWWHWGVILAG